MHALAGAAPAGPRRRRIRIDLAEVQIAGFQQRLQDRTGAAPDCACMLKALWLGLSSTVIFQRAGILLADVVSCNLSIV